MFSQFFGNYLLENNLITKEELREVLNVQEETRVKLGVLAVNLGFMKAVDLEKVHAKQATEDKLFGEIAVEMGFLTEEQLEKVLSAQSKEHHLLAQTLIDKEIMTLSELEKTYQNYKEENELTDEEFEAVKKNNIEKIVDSFLDFGSAEANEFYKDYATLVLKNIVRFISTKFRIKEMKVIEKFDVTWGAYQQAAGSRNLFTAVVAEENEFVDFGSQYADMSFEEVTELVQDSVAEFMNLLNGIFVVNCSDQGIKLDLEPPVPIGNGTFKFSEQAYLISLELEFGDVQFIVSEQLPDIVE
ncbi:MAG: hypothetical protein ACQERJ_04105 [Bacillota bacterium]